MAAGAPASPPFRVAYCLSDESGHALPVCEGGDERSGEKAEFRDVRHRSAPPKVRHGPKLTGLEENLMSILAWIVLGLIAGFISSLIVNRHGEGILLDVVIGIVGALLGGFIMSAVGGEGITGFNVYSILVAIAGAVVLLVILHAIRGTSRTSAY
jgi:uncharacterized membrane protein YeaQ/YmgE (transglycosylase-associated protein family)